VVVEEAEVVETPSARQPVAEVEAGRPLARHTVGAEAVEVVPEKPSALQPSRFEPAL
jgi:hypothetical protein